MWVDQRTFLMGTEKALDIFIKICNTKSKIISAKGGHNNSGIALQRTYWTMSCLGGFVPESC
jgi:hypothetical protein